MLPYLKLVSSDCTIYFHLEKRKRNEEWVNSSIEIYDNDYLVKSVKPFWYYCEPASLLAAIKDALEKKCALFLLSGNLNLLLSTRKQPQNIS